MIIGREKIQEMLAQVEADIDKVVDPIDPATVQDVLVIVSTTQGKGKAMTFYNCTDGRNYIMLGLMAEIEQAILRGR